MAKGFCNSIGGSTGSSSVGNRNSIREGGSSSGWKGQDGWGAQGHPEPEKGAAPPMPTIRVPMGGPLKVGLKGGDGQKQATSVGIGRGK